MGLRKISTKSEKKSATKGRRGRNFLYTIKDEEPPSFDEKTMDYMVYQRETGQDTGYVHWQCYIQFKTRRYWSSAKVYAEGHHENQKAKKNDDPREYCMKSETSIPGTLREFGKFQGQGARNDIAEARDIISEHQTINSVYLDRRIDSIVYRCTAWVDRVFQATRKRRRVNIFESYGLVPHEWQQVLFKILQAPPEYRRIIWVWSNASGTGKSRTKEHIKWMFDRVCSLSYATNRDNSHLFQPDCQVMVMDLCRQNPIDMEVTSFLEDVSNGEVRSTKYQGQVKEFDPIHIVVFSNKPAPVDKLPHRLLEFTVDPGAVVLPNLEKNNVDQ